MVGAASKAINAALWLGGSDPGPSDAAPATPADAATQPDAVGAALPPGPGPTPAHRRIGRRALRAFRPLAAPLLNRLDHRIRYALDRSRLAEAVQRIEAESSNHARSLETAAETLNRLVEHLDTISASVRMIDRTVSTSVAQLRNAIAGVETRADLAIDHTTLLLQRNAISLGRDMAVRTDGGYLLVPTEDTALVVTMFETQGRLEPGTLAVLSRLLREGDFVIDVGASVGSFTVPAARQVGTSGRVLALEPTPRIAALLKRTVALNGLQDSVTVLEYAAGASPATAQFALSEQTTHNSFWPPIDAVQTIEVDVRPLDDLVSPGQRVAVVKIDAEGAEPEIWRGMKRIRSQNEELVVLLEFGPEHLHRAGIEPASWFEELMRDGRSCWEIDDRTGSLRLLRQERLQDIRSVNILSMQGDPGGRGLTILR